ncbi:hypothetical protein [Aureimonas leprariae]|uniref:Uncharacterized protein n=1 Tax=Plantimonas leprariae TaxID=2615207 RepID=A0A7V7PNM3_9HYPH|nr:hypothetical protein [Aureimonas leprariae]KAB0679404.1 hypothetical protein F6X38_13820 [Aureimonas leprariae]
MAARFTKLQNAIGKGLKDMAVKAAIEQIDYWDEQLKGVEVSGTKGIVTDLHSLKAKLQASEPDGEAVKKLLDDLGAKTARLAGRVDDEKLGATLKDVGEGLEKSA